MKRLTKSLKANVYSSSFEGNPPTGPPNPVTTGLVLIIAEWYPEVKILPQDSIS